MIIENSLTESTKDRSDSETGRSSIQLACFRVGDQMYSLDILRIKEVIRPLRITPVPKAPIFIEGVINLRGVVLPVVDLRKRFEQPVGRADSKTRILICVLSGKMIGLIVDEVVEVKSFTRSEIQQAPRFIKGLDTDYFLGVCQRNDELVMIMNLEKILSTDEKIDLEQIRNHVPDPAKTKND
ncbi:MAG: purine-binding chemotaxis protein CheW [Desulfuromonadales bacterium]|nr:purine-binding chemotaxis protein CheW [Desulfuromonadales bacterium]